jgi:hypothetical protein
MADVAYAPKAGREDPDHFGAVFVNDFKSINVREALETGNGYIVTSDLTSSARSTWSTR